MQSVNKKTFGDYLTKEELLLQLNSIKADQLPFPNGIAYQKLFTLKKDYVIKDREIFPCLEIKLFTSTGDMPGFSSSYPPICFTARYGLGHRWSGTEAAIGETLVELKLSLSMVDLENSSSPVKDFWKIALETLAKTHKSNIKTFLKLI